MDLSIKIKENEDKIIRFILQAFIEDINDGLKQAEPNILHRIKPLFNTAIRDCPEMISLQGGTLQGELGVTNPSSKVDAIVNQLLSNINITHNKVSGSSSGIRGGFTLEMVIGDYSDILIMSDAEQITEKGQLLPWLEWLLKMGDSVIVKDYQVSFDIKNSRSRTGMAVMTKGQRWRVPPEFSGTVTDNFITRTLDLIEPDVHNIIQEEVEKVI